MRKGILEKVREARAAALRLANVPTEVKNNALRAAASAILDKREEILGANERDVEIANKLMNRGKISRALVDRLKLDEAKIKTVVKMIEDVAKLEDPVGRTLYAIELDEGLELYRVSTPIGVIGAIFESRPDVLPQISSLCLKSGNAVILKGGREARNSNEVIYGVIREATEGAGIPRGWMQLIEARAEVREMLRLEEYIDLLVPRGSKEFIKYIQKNTKIPVLGHAEGICHVYVDKDANLEMAIEICYDAKVQYPAVCNAMETLLVHESIAEDFLPRMAQRYLAAGVELRGCERTRRILKGYKIKRATEKDWATEYLDLILSIKVVKDVDEAIQHINKYGSKHTDSIVTENKKTALKFLEGVDSSSVMHNASTRFSDGYRYGLGAEVGISTGKIHARGPTGLEGLTTYKYYLMGRGNVVSNYLGPNARPFTHRKLEKEWREIVQAYSGGK